MSSCKHWKKDTLMSVKQKLKQYCVFKSVVGKNFVTSTKTVKHSLKHEDNIIGVTYNFFCRVAYHISLNI